MLPVKITFIISNVNKSYHFEHFFSELKKRNIGFQVLLLNKEFSPLERFLNEEGVSATRIHYTGKKNIPLTLFKVFSYLRKNRSKIVHTHLLDASLIGLTAAFLAGYKKRIHTRHHASYHHQYYPKAVKYDKYINRMSTRIIAISEVVKEVLITKEHVSPEKIAVLHHGFDFSKVHSSVTDERVSAIKKKYNLPPGKIIIGVVSRYIELKGIQFIIPAIAKLEARHGNIHLVLSNAGGAYANEIRTLLKTHLPKKNYTEIIFEEDIYPLFASFDYFIHTPVDKYCEAFGQVYVEALALKIPSVFTLSGIAGEFIVDKKNAMVIPYQNQNAIFDALEFLINNKSEAQQMAESGSKDVTRLFSINNLVEAYIKLTD